MFSDNYIELCALNGESPTGLAERLGFSRTAGARWINGSTPRKATLKVIADHFGVSVDYLLRDEKEKPAADSDGLSEKMLSLSADMMKLFVRFLALAEANPESAKRFLEFAVQELEHGEQSK